MPQFGEFDEMRSTNRASFAADRVVFEERQTLYVKLEVLNLFGDVPCPKFTF